jgi:hypothetical protein
MQTKRDTFAAEKAKAEGYMADLKQLHTQRNNAIRQGQQAGRFEYKFRASIDDLRMCLKRLKQDVDTYEMCGGDSNSEQWPYQARLSKNQIEKRCKDYIDLKH